MLHLDGNEPDGLNFGERVTGKPGILPQLHPFSFRAFLQVKSMALSMLERIRLKEANPNEIELAKILASAGIKQLEREGDICPTVSDLLLKVPYSIVDGNVKLKVHRRFDGYDFLKIFIHVYTLKIHDILTPSTCYSFTPLIFDISTLHFP